MPLAAGIDRRPATFTATRAVPTLGTRASSEVARDFVQLVGVCLSVGVAVGLAVMLAVLALA